MSSLSAPETGFTPQVPEWKVKELQLNLVGIAWLSQQKARSDLPTGQSYSFAQ